MVQVEGSGEGKVREVKEEDDTNMSETVDTGSYTHYKNRPLPELDHV